MSAVPTMASEAPADGPSLSAAEAWAIEHEPAQHTCPGCGAPTAGNDVCSKCSAVPCGLDGCVNCGDEAADGFCATCDPAPMLAEITGAHVSPEVARQTAAALLTGERGEIAAYLLERGDEEGARWVLARGRVSIG